MRIATSEAARRTTTSTAATLARRNDKYREARRVCQTCGRKYENQANLNIHTQGHH
ncbi:hypothetical protein SLEP1_g30663 [Rubroshorea leprosula]|uniref:C2H2-type domain-containing protein n=1 Tax=Rubroshorea leprosula TaxID=152421 RepID=A0AAV5K9M8_9ROSI|nr:hypothetical protein SLEP1_g30663 [Rubroshorea leprosula]